MRATAWIGLSVAAAGTVLGSCAAAPKEALAFAGASCARPPLLHCPEANCPGATVTNGGPVVEPKTGRTYFLDYPCDLKKGEKVTFVLSLHGGGSYGNWQRHYFPILDYVDKHRIVVATPYSPRQSWAPQDDEYLQNIVASVIGQIGAKNVRSFWLAGHSQGGMTSNRIVCTPFFRDKVDGWLSLSGGRIGPAALSPTFGLPRAANAPANAPAVQPLPPPQPGAPRPGAAQTPECDMHYIFTTGELEIAGLPADSPWAEKYGCKDRARRADVVDDKPGYVYDGNRQNPPNPAWGRAPRGGTAEVYVYPGCRDGKLVADVLRKDKGHTEGLEPKVTEALLKMMLSARGGKVAAGA